LDGVSSRKKLASAISSIKPEELNKGAISDIGQLLQGKVPGLNITKSGDPNASSAIVLRGASTINSSQSPLYVIDNIPGVDISTVAPEDIESINVLKDAAATAIYGNRAANGVIMVSTKKGKQGRAQVAYNGYFGVENVSNRLDVMNASELRKYVENNGLSFAPEDDLGADVDWQKEIQRKVALSSSHNLSISGGTEKNIYSASFTYLNKEGILLQSGLERYIGRLSVEQSFLNDKVRLGFNVSNSNSREKYTPQRNVALIQSVGYLPISPVKNTDGSYFENFNHSGYANPVALLDNAQDDSKINRLVASINAHVKLPFNLTYDLNVSYQNQASFHGEYYKGYYQKYNSIGLYSNPDPPSTKVLLSNFSNDGTATRSSFQNYHTIIENYLTWDKTIGDHGINAVLGYSYQHNVLGDGFQVTTINFPDDAVGYNNLALSNYTSSSGYVVTFGANNSYQESLLISDFGRINYNYKQRYIIQGSLRHDGSSVFGKNNHWGYFPSVGLAWRVSDESFMKPLAFLNELKLRASYGETGNSSGFNPYTAQYLMSSLGSFYYNGSLINAYGPAQAANYDLHWEKTVTKNVGVDFTIFNGKVSGTIEWYDKETKDMIYGYDADPIKIPAGWITANGGKMSNKGLELQITVSPVKTKDFRWTTDINLAHNVNEIKSLNNPMFISSDSIRYTQPDGGGQTGSTLQIRKVGKPLGEFFSLKYAGKDANGVSQFYTHDGSKTITPSTADYFYLGNPQPKLLIGWANNFSYKNWDLSVFFRGVIGNKIFNVTRADLFRPTTANSKNILKDVANESIKDYNAFKYSDRFIENGDYLRLDNATLGYNFIATGKYFKSIRVYTTVNNLFVITKYTGIDPEINQGGNALGVDSNNFYPKTRTFLFGVNFVF
jgi:iron complex outermembrane receptor protein